ncbi:hypothetical protein CHUAL_000146 [Chamberlinius hualienensis]
MGNRTNYDSKFNLLTSFVVVCLVTGVSDGGRLYTWAVSFQLLKYKMASIGLLGLMMVFITSSLVNGDETQQPPLEQKTEEHMETSTNSPVFPGVAFEVKVHVDAGKEDCFYQSVDPKASLYIAFQVIRGGDGKAGFAVKNPQGVHVHPYAWKTESEYEEVSETGGIYEICVDNQFSRFASKLVLVYITSFLYNEWENYKSELESLDISVNNFTEILRQVEGQINEMQREQQFGRRHEARDYQLLLENNSYIQNWSIAQIFVVLIASSLQVFFVRKLFDVKNVTPTSKPRA